MWNEKHNQISQMNHTVIGSISRRNGLLALYEEQYTNKTWSVERLICFSEGADIYQAYICLHSIDP